MAGSWLVLIVQTDTQLSVYYVDVLRTKYCMVFRYIMRLLYTLYNYHPVMFREKQQFNPQLYSPLQEGLYTALIYRVLMAAIFILYQTPTPWR